MTRSFDTRAARSHVPGRPANIALWCLQVVTAVAVVGAGLATVGGAAQPVEMFDRIGAGEWFRYLTGALEVAGGLGLLIPTLRGLAGLALAALWVGATATHFFVIGGNPVPAVVLLVMSCAIAYGRRHRSAALMEGVTR
ncbi:MAG: DoxX family protein [Streptosporangiales bacterium]